MHAAELAVLIDNERRIADVLLPVVDGDVILIKIFAPERVNVLPVFFLIGDDRKTVLFCFGSDPCDLRLNAFDVLCNVYFIIKVLAFKFKAAVLNKGYERLIVLRKAPRLCSRLP